jgi:hypothetical protein
MARTAAPSRSAARTPAARKPAESRALTSAPAAKPARRRSELAWLRAGDVRLVISQQVAQDRRILAALDSLVKGHQAPAARSRGRAA